MIIIIYHHLAPVALVVLVAPVALLVPMALMALAALATLGGPVALMVPVDLVALVGDSNFPVPSLFICSVFIAELSPVYCCLVLKIFNRGQ